MNGLCVDYRRIKGEYLVGGVEKRSDLWASKQSEGEWVWINLGGSKVLFWLEKKKGIKKLENVLN